MAISAIKAISKEAKKNYLEAKDKGSKKKYTTFVKDASKDYRDGKLSVKPKPKAKAKPKAKKAKPKKKK